MRRDTHEPEYRSHYEPDAADVELRETGDDGTFSVRLPIATTGEVRNEGDQPLRTEELEGMATQIEERSIGVFLDHGQNPELGSRYSAAEKVGEWRNGTVASGGSDEDRLVADAVMMDPETMPSPAGGIRGSLAAVKAQADRGFALSASIGWREDDAFPGGNDLMEASIVGIGADWRTNAEAAAASTEAMARAAVAAGADPDAFVDAVRAEMTRGRDSDVETEFPDDASELSGEEFRKVMLESQREQAELLEEIVEAELEGDEEDDREASNPGETLLEAMTSTDGDRRGSSPDGGNGRGPIEALLDEAAQEATDG